MLKINKPCTVYISFEQCPQTFKIYNKEHGLYFFRNLLGKTPRIKFNICHPGVYTSNAPFNVIKVVDIEIPENLPDLPKFERSEIKDFIIKDNPNLKSPARMFAKEGVIERGLSFYKYPKPVRVFILLHEIGHFFYGITDELIDKANKMEQTKGQAFLNYHRNESEKKCDLFAFVRFMEMGYNRSTAFYSLTTVLKRSKENTDRIKALVSNIQQTQKNNIYEN